jgi:DNA-binding response OmpR family regulator
MSPIRPMQAGTDITILLVEDDQATRAMLQSSLIAHHYTVTTTADGHSTLDLVDKFDYDLVLLDVGIPELDGISVCKRLRSKGCQIPILLLTSKDHSTDRIMGLDAGADDYVIKPVSMPELLARIRALLRRNRTPIASVTWGRLQLDPAVNEIRYGEQLLRLTPKEYGILELFLLNPQRIFSRAALIDRLWELDETPTESAISSHIKAIRQKLRAAGATQDLIETMYRFGYRLQSLELEGVPTSEGRAASNTDELAMFELWERFKDSFKQQIDLLEVNVADSFGMAQQMIDRTLT